MCLYCLLSVHLGDFVTRVHQLAEPPLLIGLAWACWATIASASVMARVAVRHPASGRPPSWRQESGQLTKAAD